MRDINSIVEEIDAYQPGEDWLGLDAMLQELFSYDIEAVPPHPLLRIFERFPTHDGFGVFWAVLHGLEGIPDYESALIQSLQRTPSRFGVLMVRRILQSPDVEAFQHQLLDLLRSISTNPFVHSEVSQDARDLVEKFGCSCELP